jgi:hypothetical protein
MAKATSRLDKLRGKYQPARTTRELCMNGALQAAFEEAQHELEAVNRRKTFESLSFGDVDPVRVAAEKVEAIREAMAGSMETFTFQAMGSKAYADLLIQHPPRKDVQEPWNSDTFVPALIAACCVDPDLDPSIALDEENLPFDVDQARELCYMLSSAQLDELFDGAYRVNVKAVDVPFSALASRTVLSSDQS